jgi:hypothetical protein
VTEEHASSIWTHGIPTDAEVKKLIDALGVPAPGTLVEYAQIEQVIGLARSENRFRSVTNAWRKKLLREQNRVTEGVRGVGVMFCAAERRVDVSERHLVKGARRIAHGVKVAVSTERDSLSSAACARLDNAVRIGTKGLEVMRDENKNRELFGLPQPRTALPPHRATAHAGTEKK